MKLPNFLLIGAAKAGTTSLYHYLRQHPQIFLSPVKETYFFGRGPEHIMQFGPDLSLVYNLPITHVAPQHKNRLLRPLIGPLGHRLIRDLHEYASLFAGATDEIALGEASPAYLRWPRAATEIRATLPEAKLLAILRQPADRSFSSFLMWRRAGQEPLADFGRAWAASARRCQEGWLPALCYGLEVDYAPALRRYYELFPREQIRVWLYDDLVADPRRLLREMYSFLGVDEDFTPDVRERHNATRQVPRSYHLYRFTETAALWHTAPDWLRRRVLNRTRKRLREYNVTTPPKFDPALRRKLTAHFRADILATQELIGRDLSHWFKVQSSRFKVQSSKLVAERNHEP